MYGVAGRRWDLEVTSRDNGTVSSTRDGVGLSQCVGLQHLVPSTSGMPLQIETESDNVLNSIYYLYTLIRRPRMILDFSLTLIFNHLVLTTYYAASFPTTIFFWGVMTVCAAMMIIVAEQLCVKREMTEGLTVAAPAEDEDVEMGSLLRRD